MNPEPLTAAVLAELKEIGFRNVTIGVGSDEPQNFQFVRLINH